MKTINNMTCDSGDKVLDLLKKASAAVGRVQSDFKNELDFLMIAQPLDAVITYLENNDIKVP